MLELVTGSLIGCITSIIITHFYYKKATSDLEQLKKDIKTEIENLSEIVNFIGQDAVQISEDTNLIRKQISNEP